MDPEHRHGKEQQAVQSVAPSGHVCGYPLRMILLFPLPHYFSPHLLRIPNQIFSTHRWTALQPAKNLLALDWSERHLFLLH
jgi:hypothetical protein